MQKHELNVTKYFYRAGLQPREKRNGQGIKNCYGHDSDRVMLLTFLYLSQSLFYLTTNFFSSICVHRLENETVTFLNDLLNSYHFNLSDLFVQKEIFERTFEWMWIYFKTFPFVDSMMIFFSLMPN